MSASSTMPAVPLVGLRLAGVISGPICGFYCALSIIAMVGLILCRRDEYQGAAAASGR